MAALDLFAIVSIIVFFYPYLAGQTWVVGQDSFWRYIDPLNALVGLTPSQAFNTSASHGTNVVFLYLIQSATGLSSVSIVRYAPLNTVQTPTQTFAIGALLAVLSVFALAGCLLILPSRH